MAQPLPDILVVAATPAELRGRAGLACGVGPVEATAAVAQALAAHPNVRTVVHVGIAGARPGSGVDVLEVVVGSEAVYEDLATSVPLAPNRVAGDQALLEAAVRAVGARPLAIGTSAALGGTRSCPVEAMEGFGVLRAAQLAGVPAIEVRVVSNLVGEPRQQWRVEEALARLAEIVPPLVAEIGAALEPGSTVGRVEY